MKEQFKESIDALLETVGIQPDHKLILVSIAAALILALVMLIAYKLANRPETYQPKFAATLVVLALVSVILMDLIQSNIALSLGMLGSLSIVRFRTNIRDPRDIGFIFWAMAIGIAASTESYFLGVSGSIVLAAIMIFTKNRGISQSPRLLVIRGSNADLDRIQNIVSVCTQNYVVKAKNILSDSFELVYEVQIPEKNEHRAIENIFEIGGIDSVNLLAQNV